jgi:probable HAF family extracellular repeat protein
MKKICGVTLLHFFIISVITFMSNTFLFSQQAVTYIIVDLGTLGGLTSLPIGINDNGDVVGYSQTTENTDHPFIYHNGVMTDLGTLGGPTGYAKCINDAGQVAGSSQTEQGGAQFAFIYQNGTMTNIGTLGGPSSVANGINDLGHVVGSAYVDPTNAHAFLYSNGIMNDLGTLNGTSSWANAVNSSDQVVGGANNPVGHAFLYENGVMTDLGTLGYSSSVAVDINDSGHVVGYADSPGRSMFIYQNGVMADLGQVGTPRGINNLDQVVGYYSSPTGGAFIWQNGIRSDLNDLVEPGSGWRITHANAINDQRVITAYAYQIANPQSPHAILLIPNNLLITRPQAGELFIAGEPDTIKWIGGKAGQLLQIEYSTDSSNIFNVINFGISGDTSFYVWNDPDSILSAKCSIRIFDMIDPTIADTSDIFKIKGYVLTKYKPNGDFEPYNMLTDKWGFANNASDVWPASWYNRFNYQGIDPFTGSQYSQWQGNFVFASSISSEHPDWPSFVNTFGTSACYFSTSLEFIHLPH